MGGPAADSPQIGFLTEWQMYAQKLEGDSWQGEVLDKGKIDKMSGMSFSVLIGLGVRTGANGGCCTDQQLGQLYELMKATRDLEGGGEGAELGREGGKEGKEGK